MVGVDGRNVPGTPWGETEEAKAAGNLFFMLLLARGEVDPRRFASVVSCCGCKIGVLTLAWVASSHGPQCICP